MVREKERNEKKMDRDPNTKYKRKANRETKESAQERKTKASRDYPPETEETVECANKVKEWKSQRSTDKNRE